MSSVFVIFFSILFGTLAARYKDKWIDNIIRLMAYAGIAIPSFVLAVLLLLLFGYLWPVLPILGRLSPGIAPPPTVTGLITVDALVTGNINTFLDAFKHLIVPALALATGAIFQEARILRSAMIDNREKDYIALVTAYGVPKRVITSKYLLKPSMIPSVSVMGLDIAGIMTSGFIVERIYNWPGLSRYGMEAMLRKDLNAISSVIVIYGLIFVIINIIVDIIIAYLDPRTRLGGQN
jgi:peptide/nickel transport system permease protein